MRCQCGDTVHGALAQPRARLLQRRQQRVAQHAVLAGQVAAEARQRFVKNLHRLVDDVAAVLALDAGQHLLRDGGCSRVRQRAGGQLSDDGAQPDGGNVTLLLLR